MMFDINSPISIFADFIANDKPLLCSHNGSITSPVIKEYFVDMGVAQWKKEFLNIEWKDLEYDFAIWPLVPFYHQILTLCLDMHHLVKIIIY